MLHDFLSAGSTVTAHVSAEALDKVLITAQMRSRPRRPPNPSAESHAMGELRAELAGRSGNFWQRLCEQALALCGAHSAGVSIEEPQAGETVFRWKAVAGKWACYAGGCMPRDASPCGVATDLATTQLMKRPAALFPLLRAAKPELVEALVAPFRVPGECIGALWVLSHDLVRKFDSEDARLLESLASFAVGSGAAVAVCSNAPTASSDPP